MVLLRGIIVFQIRVVACQSPFVHFPFDLLLICLYIDAIDLFSSLIYASCILESANLCSSAEMLSLHNCVISQALHERGLVKIRLVASLTSFGGTLLQTINSNWALP